MRTFAWLPALLALACYHTGREARGYSSAAERDEEYRVYEAVLKAEFARDSVVILSDRTGGPVMMTRVCVEGATIPECIPDVAEALADLDAKRDVKLQPFGGRVRLVPRAKSKSGCNGAFSRTISRVGFNKRRDVAVVGVSESVGFGPFPGCGYATGGASVYRRVGNTWRPAGGFGQFIT